MNHSHFTLAFPMKVDSSGRIAVSSGTASIEESIKLILTTTPGERALCPDFGCRASELLFAPSNCATAALLSHYVREALTAWEPRIASVRVEAVPSAESIDVTVRYTVRSTGRPDSTTVRISERVQSGHKGEASFHISTGAEQ